MIKTVVKVNITVNNKEIELTHDEMKQLYYQIKPYIVESIIPTIINKNEWDYRKGYYKPTDILCVGNQK